MTEILPTTAELEFVIDDGETEVEYRLTFGACTGYQKSLFDRYRERSFGIIADEFMPPAEGDKKPVVVGRKRYAEMAKALSRFDLDMAETKLNAMIIHAATLASLKKVEVKKDEAWVDGKLPDFWYDMSEAAEKMSPELADALLTRTFMVNPARLFGFLSDTDDEKKDLRLTVPKS